MGPCMCGGCETCAPEYYGEPEPDPADESTLCDTRDTRCEGSPDTDDDMEYMRRQRVPRCEGVPVQSGRREAELTAAHAIDRAHVGAWLAAWRQDCAEVS